MPGAAEMLLKMFERCTRDPYAYLPSPRNTYIDRYKTEVFSQLVNAHRYAINEEFLLAMLKSWCPRYLE